MIRSRLDFIKIAGLVSAGFLLNKKVKLPVTDFQQELPSLMMDDYGNPINTISSWEEKRKSIVKRWTEYLGILDPNPDPPKLKIITEEISDGIIRQLVEYESEPGLLVRSYLLKPQKTEKPLPGVVALHSTSDNQMLYIAGVEKGTIAALGYNLAKRGFVVICPKCFLWRTKVIEII